jgi:hypothetical protein
MRSLVKSMFENEIPILMIVRKNDILPNFH